MNEVSVDALLLDGGKMRAQFHTTALFLPPLAAVAWTGSTYLLTWCDVRGLKMISISGDGERISPLPATIAPSPYLGFSEMPAIANGDGITLIVYKEQDHLGQRARALRFNRYLDLLDAQPLVLSDDDTTREEMRPSVTWDGQSFVVALNRNGGTELAHVTPGGTVVRFGALPRISGVPSLASDGVTTFLLLTEWFHRDRFDLHRLDRNGSLTFLGSIKPETPFAFPQLAPFGTGVVMLYDDATSDTEFVRHAYMRTVDDTPSGNARRRAK
jgi:hypothetical protein